MSKKKQNKGVWVKDTSIGHRKTNTGYGSGLPFVLSQFTVIDTLPTLVYFTPYITSAIVGVWYPFAFNKIGGKERINSDTGRKEFQWKLPNSIF
ncbi:Uncharacterised protein [Niallia circulans]|uniref:Uncharacterized protein n=1 Tax=Shouchella clausii TaxID=79880 RepID=A0A268RWZ6_SHOCL|nr:hypothetical protein [Shouchella clausii]PAD41735.1 hypothetical protein CHH54_15660 [Bacillus sp. 7520-S]SPU22326.1 Uncharacterised protein [Niallia circulans]AST98286.1 hypothetical protein BC8716_21010 [Shouchella clausii]MBU8595156.1 hypothetical protein [Shouchella clausii]MCM3550079.1 hypothetical protein [Shouchella clausii]